MTVLFSAVPAAYETFAELLADYPEGVVGGDLNAVVGSVFFCRDLNGNGMHLMPTADGLWWRPLLGFDGPDTAALGTDDKWFGPFGHNNTVTTTTGISTGVMRGLLFRTPRGHKKIRRVRFQSHAVTTAGGTDAFDITIFKARPDGHVLTGAAPLHNFRFNDGGTGGAVDFSLTNDITAGNPLSWAMNVKADGSTADVPPLFWAFFNHGLTTAPNLYTPSTGSTASHLFPTSVTAGLPAAGTSPSRRMAFAWTKAFAAGAPGNFGAADSGTPEWATNGLHLEFDFEP